MQNDLIDMQPRHVAIRWFRARVSICMHILYRLQRDIHKVKNKTSNYEIVA